MMLSNVIELVDTNSSEVNRALSKLPNSSESGGLVFTLIIVCTISSYESALEAALQAAYEHPSRIVVAVCDDTETHRFDARVGTTEDMPGAIIVLHLAGEVSEHADSVIVPLLLPDLPAVVWWPSEAPPHPAADRIGKLVTRRITDIWLYDAPLTRLLELANSHLPGGTDLSWTRITRWRAILADALDQVQLPVLRAEVATHADSVPAELLASWLQSTLNCPVKAVIGTDAGLIKITLMTDAGNIVLTHRGDNTGELQVPGQPDSNVVLPLRTPNQLLSEELRNLDSDPIFDEVMETVLTRGTRGNRGAY